MKVLLVAPPKTGVYGSERYPPIGLGYIASILKSNSHEVDIKDCIILNWDENALFKYISEFKPDVIGITLFSQAFSSVESVLKRVKKEFPKLITIVGGPHPTALPEKVLVELPDADYGCNGEGEYTLKLLLDKIKNKDKSYVDVPGLIWRDGDKNKFNAKLEHEPVDDFGMPDWELINPNLYNVNSINIEEKTAVILTSRGCPFPCRFCVRLGKKLRLRKVENIYDEMIYLNKKYGIKKFHLGDEGFPINKQYVKEFCRFMIEKGDGFEFFASCGLRLNTLDSEMLELMKQAKFKREFNVGIESCVPKVRNNLMKKNLLQDDLINGLRLLNKHGFKPNGNFILGYPGETKQDILESIKIALTLPLLGANFSPFLPLPGSEETKTLIENGEIPENFDYSRIKMDSVLYAPKGMTPLEIDNLRKRAVFLFNIRPRVLFGKHLSRKNIVWSFFKFIKIFTPNFLLPKSMKREVK